MVDLNWEMQNKAWLSNGVVGFNFNLTKSGANYSPVNRFVLPTAIWPHPSDHGSAP